MKKYKVTFMKAEKTPYAYYTKVSEVVEADTFYYARYKIREKYNNGDYDIKNIEVEEYEED